MRGRPLIWIAALLGPACGDANQVFAPVELAEHQAAILVRECARSVDVLAIDLRVSPVVVDVPDDCEADDPLTLLLYEQSLDELDISVGPMPRADCQRDETAWETCCTPESLPPSSLVLEATPSALRFEPRSSAALPESIASFRHNARCPCHPLRRREIFSERARATAVFPDGPDAFFLGVGRTDENRTDIYHATIEAVRSGEGLGRPIGEIDVRLQGGALLPSGRWLIWDGNGGAWLGTLDGPSEPLIDPLFKGVENFDASTEGADEVVFTRRARTGTDTFARFDGAIESLAPGVPPIERECTERQSDGELDGQEAGALWLGPGRYLSAPEHLVGGIHPDGYWLHQDGRSDWVELGSTTGCMTSIGQLEDGTLVHATGARRFKVHTPDGWQPLEVVDGPNGPTTTPSEVRVIEGYRGGFAFAGNNGMLGTEHSGLFCEVVELGSPSFRRITPFGDALLAEGKNTFDDEIQSVWIFWPED